MESTIVSNIQPYSIHDGSGIRTVVFLKGCPLRCRWCANPENLETGVSMGFISKLCKSCGRCAGVCPSGAIIPGEGVYRIDRERCTACGVCADTCWYAALVKYGKPMTSAEVFKAVSRDKMFYDESGGGVTFSGGEPLTHPGFVREVFELCREAGVGTCVETCGCVPWESFEAVRELTDMFLFDIKFADPSAHEKYTGASNARILDNARRLAASGADILFRRPLIAGINDGEAETAATAEFIKNLGRAIPLQLMPYHRMGVSKYEALNREYSLPELEPMSVERARATAERYKELGVNCGVSE